MPKRRSNTRWALCVRRRYFITGSLYLVGSFGITGNTRTGRSALKNARRISGSGLPQEYAAPAENRSPAQLAEAIFFLMMTREHEKAEGTRTVNNCVRRIRNLSSPSSWVSKSDWQTMEHAAKTLEELGVPHEVARCYPRTARPTIFFEYASTAEERGLEVIIAAAGGAAHLAGVTARKTILPVLGVPMESPSLKGLDSLLSTVQMPGGIPVGTLAIGKPGAINAALFAPRFSERNIANSAGHP